MGRYGFCVYFLFYCAACPHRVGMRSNMWLQDRDATVWLGGECSSELLLRNQVFQGIVWGIWGPALWNIFFASVLEAANEEGFESLAFADDLNSFKTFPEAVPNQCLHNELAGCQTRIHEWGFANQITSDSKKESLTVISRYHPAGDNIKFLGVIIYMHLRMVAEIEPLVQKAHWKVIHCYGWTGFCVSKIWRSNTRPEYFQCLNAERRWFTTRRMVILTELIVCRSVFSKRRSFQRNTHYYFTILHLSWRGETLRC